EADAPVKTGPKGFKSKPEQQTQISETTERSSAVNNRSPPLQLRKKMMRKICEDSHRTTVGA
ncbi:hypothetical protein A2U01_0086808, partial [Trifolium medium]|nr:hypothetical protein [Trifolium medium]